VFPHPQLGTVLDASKLRKRFDKAVTAAKVRPVNFHSLRHSYATAMAAAGTPLRTLQEWMGHADARTTAIYADYLPNPVEGRALTERAFGGSNWGSNLSETQDHSEELSVPDRAQGQPA
jgi:integrase